MSRNEERVAPAEQEEQDYAADTNFVDWERIRNQEVSGEDSEASGNDNESAEAEESAESESASAAGENEESEEQPKKPKETGQDRNWKRLREAKAAAEREAAQLRQQIQEREKTSGKTEKSDEVPKAPRLQDYSDYNSYEQDLAKYVDQVTQQRAQEVVKAERARQAEERQQQTQQEAQEAVQKRWTSEVAALAKDAAYADFEDVVYGADDAGVFTPTMRQFFAEARDGARTAYHLAQDDDRLQELSQLTPTEQMAELGRVRAEVTSDKQKPPVRRSPKPPKKVRGEGSPKKTLDEISDYTEWERERNRQVRAKT